MDWIFAGKDMNPFALLLAVVSRLGFLSFGSATSLGEGNTEFKSASFCWKMHFGSHSSSDGEVA